MKNLIVIAQNIDENDDHRGFFVGWLREFAKTFDKVSVITLARGSYELPANVHVYSLGKEQGASMFTQAVRFYRHLARLIPGSAGIFAHASPIFVIAAWPLAFVYRKRILLWYLHRSVTLRLRLALALCDTLVTADAQSLRIQNPKIVSVGHGIDTARFAVPDRQPPTNRPLRVLSVGRLSPIKDFGTLIRAAALVRERKISLEVRIVGRAVMPTDHAYANDLSDLVSRLGVSDIVHFFGFESYREMPAQYRWADVVVGCTPRGGLDKVLLEGMAAGCVALTSNDAMRDTLGEDANHFIFSHGDAPSLAEHIVSIGDFAAASMGAVAAVREHHELKGAISRISEIMSR